MYISKGFLTSHSTIDNQYYWPPMNFVCIPRAMIAPSSFLVISTSKNASLRPALTVLASIDITSPGNAAFKNLCHS